MTASLGANRPYAVVRDPARAMARIGSVASGGRRSTESPAWFQTSGARRKTNLVPTWSPETHTGDRAVVDDPLLAGADQKGEQAVVEDVELGGLDLTAAQVRVPGLEATDQKESSRIFTCARTVWASTSSSLPMPWKLASAAERAATTCSSRRGGARSAQSSTRQSPAAHVASVPTRLRGTQESVRQRTPDAAGAKTGSPTGIPSSP